MSGFSQSSVLARAAKHVQAGNADLAEPLCREVLRKDRKNALALGILGQVAALRGEQSEAAKCFEKCIALEPQKPEFHSLLAESLASLGRYKQALSRYEKLLRLKPGFYPAVTGRAEIFYRQREFDKALGVVEPFINDATEDGAMAVVFLRVAAHAGRYEKAADVASRQLADTRLTPEIRRSLLFALGHLHERAGAYDEAFKAYTEGNRLSDRRYSHEEDVARTHQIMAVFSADSIAAAPKPAHTPELPVFVVGMMRSGSTLVEQILDAHPEAHGAGELMTLPRLAAAMPLTIGSTLPYPQCVRDLSLTDVDRIGGEYLDHVRRLGRGAKRVVDKQLGNYLDVGLIAILFPHARVVHCRRDPLDTCLSIYTQRLRAGIHGYASDLRMLGQAYREYERLMAYWRGLAPIPMLEVQYEDLVADQEAVSRRIIDFCDLPWDDRCLRYYETGRPVLTLSMNQVSQPIYRTSVGRADRFGHHLDPLRKALAGEPAP